MILNDRQIRDLCVSRPGRERRSPGVVVVEPAVVVGAPMIEPYEPKLVRKGVVSYGQSSLGYDMRAGNHWKIFTDIHGAVVDPKQTDEQAYYDKYAEDGEAVLIPPNSYALTHTKEYIRMPRDVIGICMGKSTYARVGVQVPLTPIEPGWEGEITVEVSNGSRLPVKVYAGEGIMQVLFFRGDAPDVSYADRGGKYLGQRGITFHRVEKE